MLPDTMPELLYGLFCLGCETWFPDSGEHYQTHECSDFTDQDEDED